jgi:hypothetical protein
MNPKIGPGIQAAVKSQHVVISTVMNLPDPTDSDSPEYVRSINEWSSRHVGSSVDPTEPFVQFLYPVLVDSADLDKANNVTTPVTESENKTTVAVTGTTFFWKSFLEEILPVGERGIVVVIGNQCGQVVTYQVDGSQAVYIGSGDLHNPRYASMGETYSLTELSSFHLKDTYLGLPLTQTYCAYSISVYPSAEMEETYKSSDAIIFTAAAVFIFLFTALVFLAYDKLVAKRQAQVMKSAMQSNAIVSSLFPSNVRDRLYLDTVRASDKKTGGILTYQPTKIRLKSFLHDADHGNDSGGLGNPIADLFPDCTVIFADIASFTAWSSEREPGQVFKLLETVYGAFDKIAERRGVFKVEVSQFCAILDPQLELTNITLSQSLIVCRLLGIVMLQ